MARAPDGALRILVVDPAAAWMLRYEFLIS